MSDRTGFSFIAVLALLFSTIYFVVALTPEHLPKPQAELIDVSPLALQTKRINAIPWLLRNIPATTFGTKILASCLILAGSTPLIPSLLLLVSTRFGVLKSLFEPFFRTVLQHQAFNFIFFIFFIVCIICNRLLRAGYGLYKLDKACIRVGWNPNKWRKITRQEGEEACVANDTPLELLLRMLAITCILIGFIFIGGAVGGGIGTLLFFGIYAALAKVKGRRIKAILAKQTPIDAGSNPIVYLRAFVDDASLSIPASFLHAYSIEEGICIALSESGKRIVALGKPGEKLPPLGADRFYVGDEEWQEVISNWLQRAHQIVMVASTTSATKWEKEEALRLGGLARLLILFPLATKDRFLETFSRVQNITGTPLQLPKLNEKTSLCGIYFDHGNRPKMIVSSKAKLPDLIETIKWHKHVLMS